FSAGSSVWRSLQCSKENCVFSRSSAGCLVAWVHRRRRRLNGLPPANHWRLSVATLLDVAKLGAVLDDAYADLFGVAPHMEDEGSTRNLLAKRIVDLARMGETDSELLKQYAMAGFVLR